MGLYVNVLGLILIIHGSGCVYGGGVVVREVLPETKKLGNDLYKEQRQFEELAAKGAYGWAGGERLHAWAERRAVKGEPLRLHGLSCCHGCTTHNRICVGCLVGINSYGALSEHATTPSRPTRDVIVSSSRRQHQRWRWQDNRSTAAHHAAVLLGGGGGGYERPRELLLGEDLLPADHHDDTGRRRRRSRRRGGGESRHAVSSCVPGSC